MGTRESEGCIRAVTSGNGRAPGPGRAKAARVGVIFRRDPWPALRRRKRHVTATSKGRGRVVSTPPTPAGQRATCRALETYPGPLQLLWRERQLPQSGATGRSDEAELARVASPSKQPIASHVGEIRGAPGALPSAHTSDSRADLGSVATSRISGGAGWWKSPSPDLERALGERSPGATRQLTHPQGVRTAEGLKGA